jgi:hypothetical protein
MFLFRLKALLFAGFVLQVRFAFAVSAEDGVTGVTAVYSQVTSDYLRSKLPDGTFQPEYFAFGEGGLWGGAIKDETVDQLHFSDVARIIADPLASQKFFPATHAAKTKLLIMVYWGTTVATDLQYKPMMANVQSMMDEYRIMLEEGNPGAGSVLSAAMTLTVAADHQRDRLANRNAAILGYDSTGLIGTDYGNGLRSSGLGLEQRDLVAEVEDYRYFVVLMAYDFQLLWKEKKHKLLWTTRFSISEHRNQFDRALPLIARYASRYFGQPTGVLLRERVPEGHVDIGELKSLGEAPDK